MYKLAAQFHTNTKYISRAIKKHIARGIKKRKKI